jgi:hypothetical protein
MTGILTILAFGVFNPATAVGPDAMRVNPAQLAWPERPGFACRLLDLEAGAANNSFSLSQYNRYTGAYLDETAKSDILGSIPKRGLALGGLARAGACEFGYANLAASVRTVATADASLPKDAFDLVLFGNELGRVYRATGTGARAQVYWCAGAGMGTAIGRNWAVGVAGHRVQGLYYAGLTDAAASFLTTEQAFASSGRIAYRTATGGSGWAFDAGVAFLRDKWRFSLGCLDASPGINWDQGVETGTYAFSLDSGNVFEIATQGRFKQEFSRGQSSSFTTNLPLLVNLAAGRRFADWLNVGLLLQQRLRDGDWTRNFSANAVCELWPVWWLPVAAELGYRSWAGPVFGLDLGLIWRRFAFTLGARDLSGLIMAAKGAEVHLGIGYGTFFQERPASIPDTLHYGYD